MHEARPMRWSARKSVETIKRCCLAGALQLGAELREFGIERQAAHMRADHGERHAFVDSLRIGFRRRQLALRLAERKRVRALPGRAELEQHPVPARMADEGDAEGHAVVAKACRQRERRKTEEVH